MNIVEGKPQVETGYIFNDQCFLPSPKTYPAGFPILLAPLYYFFGNSILAFSYFISFVLFLLGFVLYYFFRIYFSRLISWCSVLIIIYNPWTLRFKAEILADLPFMLLLMLSLIFYLNLNFNCKTFLRSLLLGFFMAFSMLLKSIGVVLLISILTDIILLIIKKLIRHERKDIKNIIANFLVTAGSSFLFYVMIGYVLIPTVREPIAYYQSLYNFRDFGNLLVNILNNWVREFQGFFPLAKSNWKILSLLTVAIASILMIIGFIKKCAKNPGIFELLVLMYSFVALSFPTSSQGFRYLFPILPVYIYFIINGAQSFPLGSKVNSNCLLILIAVLCLLQYPGGIADLLAEQGKMTVGPQEKQSIEVFQYIRENTSKKAVIAFIKSTVLSLYAERNCIANRRDQDVAGMAAKFEQVGVDYYLTNTDLANSALDRFLLENKEKIRLIWSNEKFKLYKKIN
jgi:hypothetical protein